MKSKLYTYKMQEEDFICVFEFFFLLLLKINCSSAVVWILINAQSEDVKFGGYEQVLWVHPVTSITMFSSSTWFSSAFSDIWKRKRRMQTNEDFEPSLYNDYHKQLKPVNLQWVSRQEKKGGNCFVLARFGGLCYSFHIYFFFLVSSKINKKFMTSLVHLKCCGSS